MSLNSQLSRSTVLDPRTNDPYLDEKGRFVIAAKQQELVQRFDVLLHTNWQSVPTNLSYGIPYRLIEGLIANGTKPENAILIYLIQKIQENVEPLLTGFDINGITIDNDAIKVTLNVTLKGKNTTANTTVTV